MVMPEIVLIIATFLSAMFIDVYWTLYMKHYTLYLADRTQKERHLSSFYSMMVGFCAWVSYDLSIHNYFLFPFLLMGYYAGVYFADDFEKMFIKLNEYDKKLNRIVATHIY